jgi:hypothetical protein
LDTTLIRARLHQPTSYSSQILDISIFASIEMFSSTVFSTTTLAVLTACQLACSTPINPAPRQNLSAGSVTATLIGAAGAQYTMAIAMDENVHLTNNDLGISHINTSGGPCDFFGVNGAVVSFPAAGAQDIGPPQTIVAAACGPRPAAQSREAVYFVYLEDKEGKRRMGFLDHLKIAMALLDK